MVTERGGSSVADTDLRSANEVHEATVGGKENCLATTGCLAQTKVHETL